MSRKSLVKGAGILAILGLIVATGMQGGSMMNLHGGQIVNNDMVDARSLSVIEPAAGGYDAEEANKNAECVVKARGVGSLTTCD